MDYRRYNLRILSCNSIIARCDHLIVKPMSNGQLSVSSLWFQGMHNDSNHAYGSIVVNNKKFFSPIGL